MFSPQRLRQGPLVKRWRRDWEREAVHDYSRTAFFSHTAGQLHLWPLSVCAQNLSKTKPDKTPSRPSQTKAQRGGVRVRKSLCWLRSYWQLMAVRRGEPGCLQGSRPREATHAPVDSAVPMHMLAPVSELWIYKRKKNTWNWEERVVTQTEFESKGKE